MAEQDNNAPHRVHNPFDAPAPKNGGGFLIGLALALALNAGLIFWVAQSKFAIKEKLFEDEKLDTQLIKPPPPPVRARPPAPIADAPPAPVILPVPPTPKRVETTAPPVIAPPSPPTPPPPSVITRPDWARKPGSDDMARFYPDRASRLEKSGRVQMKCRVRANGTLESCSILSEDPGDF